MCVCVHVCVWLVWCVCDWCSVCVWGGGCRGGGYCTEQPQHNVGCTLCMQTFVSLTWGDGGGGGYCTGYLTTAWCGMHTLHANVCQLDILGGGGGGVLAFLELCGRFHFRTTMTAAVSEE